VRASRLVQLILVLQRRGKTTARALAAELEVSVRTVYRDIEALSGIGVPVYAESGPGGGVSLLDGYQTRLTGLTAPEASALGLAGVPEVAAQLGLRSVLVAAQSKVDAALPPELRQRSLRLRERFLIDVPGWFERAEDVPWLASLSDAVWDGRQVDVVYAGPARTVHRRLDPLGLVLQGATWYLVAGAAGVAGAVGAAGPIRTYRVGRLDQVRICDTPVERPADFDLAAHWRAATAEFDRSMRPLLIRIRLPRADLRMLRWSVTPGAFDEATASIADEHDDPVTLAMHAESVDVAVHELLRLAPSVEVLDPPELRERLRAIGTAMARRHRRSPPPSGG